MSTAHYLMFIKNNSSGTYYRVTQMLCISYIASQPIILQCFFFVLVSGVVNSWWPVNKLRCFDADDWLTTPEVIGHICTLVILAAIFGVALANPSVSIDFMAIFSNSNACHCRLFTFRGCLFFDLYILCNCNTLQIFCFMLLR